MRFVSAVALALVMLWVPVDGVAQVDELPNPLRGLTTVDATVFVDWDDRISGKTEEQYTREVERAFELGILRAGLNEDSDAPNYLTCSTNFITANEAGTLVAFTRRIVLREMNRAGIIGD
jgi:hypothetical protein